MITFSRRENSLSSCTNRIAHNLTIFLNCKTWFPSIKTEIIFHQLHVTELRHCSLIWAGMSFEWNKRLCCWRSFLVLCVPIAWNCYFYTVVTLNFTITVLDGAGPHFQPLPLFTWCRRHRAHFQSRRLACRGLQGLQKHISKSVPLKLLLFLLRGDNNAL